MEDTKENRLLAIITNMSIGELPKSHGENGNNIWNAFHIGVQWQKLQSAQQSVVRDRATAPEKPRELGKHGYYKDVLSR